MDIYPQLLARPTGGNFTPIFGKAGVVDGTLVRMYDQSGQTVLTVFVPKESNHTSTQNLIYYTKSHCVRK